MLLIAARAGRLRRRRGPAPPRPRTPPPFRPQDERREPRRRTGRWLTARAHRGGDACAPRPAGARSSGCAPRTEFGSPKVLGVVRRRGGLAAGRRARAPERPPRLDPGARAPSSAARISRCTSTARAASWSSGAQAGWCAGCRSRSAAPANPTPTGRFAVTDRLRTRPRATRPTAAARSRSPATRRGSSSRLAGRRPPRDPRHAAAGDDRPAGVAGLPAGPHAGPPRADADDPPRRAGVHNRVNTGVNWAKVLREQRVSASAWHGSQVFHCDDSHAFTRLVGHWLAEHAEFEHVGAAHTGEEALAALPAARPDVVLLDTMGTPGRPLAAGRHPRRRAAGRASIVYSGYLNLIGRAAIENGADAYVEKADDEAALVERDPRGRARRPGRAGRLELAHVGALRLEGHVQDLRPARGGGLEALDHRARRLVVGPEEHGRARRRRSSRRARRARARGAAAPSTAGTATRGAAGAGGRRGPAATRSQSPRASPSTSRLAWATLNTASRSGTCAGSAARAAGRAHVLVGHDEHRLQPRGDVEARGALGGADDEAAEQRGGRVVGMALEARSRARARRRRARTASRRPSGPRPSPPRWCRGRRRAARRSGS